ncbi:MAG: molybdenum cofactor guanylyltransferase MobA [Methylobacteriaceae bacterium]|nr:molybdenum cofactor guanylyltransferase MobA [Methylobacteriaceae bacterium]
MTDAPPTLGLILAGGLSRRMGGGDKPLARVGGVAIVDRVIAALRPQCASLVLNANGDPARFAAQGLPVVADDVPGFAGPLAGVLAGLDHCARAHPQIAWVVSVAADSPFLPADLAARLQGARIAGGARLACAASGGHTHPVIGLWPVDLAADLRRALVEEDIRKIDRFTARYPIATVEWPATPVDPFFNANTPEELVEAERIAAGEVSR